MTCCIKKIKIRENERERRKGNSQTYFLHNFVQFSMILQVIFSLVLIH